MEQNNADTVFNELPTSILETETEQYNSKYRQSDVDISQVDNNETNQATNNVSISTIARDMLNTRRTIEAHERSANGADTVETTNANEPIVGYAAEPILPLQEACEPLADIFHDLSFYVQMALNETPEEPLDGLTIDESAAIRLYTIEWEPPHPSLYSSLNHTLKTAPREELQPYFGYLKLFLTGLAKIPCLPPLTVWRGVTKNLSAEFPPGTRITWWPFSSCTHELTVLENNLYLGTDGERTLFSLEAINARTIRNHSHFVTEDEVLLLPGTYMEVQSQVSPATGLHIIHLKQIKPPLTLLEPPFEGALLYPPEKLRKPWYRKTRIQIELGIILMLCIVGIIIGAVRGSRKPPPPPICIPRTTNVLADYFWSFNCGDLREDLTGLYNATPINGTITVSPDFPGYGQAMQLNRQQFQYATLPRSLNLTLNTSFTVSGWILLAGYKRKTILSDCNDFNPLCITFIIADGTMIIEVSNWNDGTLNQQLVAFVTEYLCQSCWMHVAFSYNHVNGSTIFYMNAINVYQAYLNLTSVSSSSGQQQKRSYFGLNAVTKLEPFYGLLDQFAVLYAVKTPTTLLYEATVISAYNFDTNEINRGTGPNSILAVSQHVYRIEGNNESSLLLNDTDSYFQSSGFALLYGDYYEHSIVFWLRVRIPRPRQMSSGVAILQISTEVNALSTNSYVCALMVHVNQDNQTLSFLFPGIFYTAHVNNSFIPNDTWVHIGFTFQRPSTYRFYQNGTLIHSDSYDRFASMIYGNPRFAATLGGAYLNDSDPNKPSNFESMKCFATLPMYNYTKMYGEIDNFALYARTLSEKEIATLADSVSE